MATKDNHDNSDVAVQRLMNEAVLYPKRDKTCI